MRKLVLVSALALAMPVAAHAQITFNDLGLDLNASNVDFQKNQALSDCQSQYNSASKSCNPP